MTKQARVFLGGTCNETTWRDELIKLLEIDYFNPVVADWTPEHQKIEIEEKEKCNIHLYLITKEMTGVFSIAEAVHSAHNKNVVTLLHIMPSGFDSGQLKSLDAVIDLVNSIIIPKKLKDGGAYFSSLMSFAALNINLHTDNTEIPNL